MKRDSELFDKLVDQRGTVIVLIALLLVILLAFSGLALDIGYLMVVRTELQNGADAAALAGASFLFPGNPDPNWSLAQAQATATISRNKANNATLTNCQVQTGYWNLTGAPAGLQSTSITPGPNDVPAVMVTVSKSPGNNGGPVRLFFGPVLGINSEPVSARAVAAGVIPSSAGPRTLLPFAVAQPAFGGPRGSLNVLEIGPAYGNGQWTSFAVIGDDANYIEGLMTDGGNPSTINIGDQIYTQSLPTPPQSLAPLYAAAQVFKGKTVFIPIVTQIEPGTTQPVVALGAFHILDINPGNQYIEGYIDYNVKIPIGSAGGTWNYGVYTPAALVK